MRGPVFLTCLASIVLAGCFSYVPPDPPLNWAALLAERIPALGDDFLRSSVMVDAKTPILLRFGEMSDSTRHRVEATLLLNKMKDYLVNNGGGRIQVFDTSADVENFRRARVKEAMHRRFKGDIAMLASRIDGKYRRRNVKIAVAPVMNQRNVGDVCADGFVALLRDRIVSEGMGNITFLDWGKRSEADYILGGELAKVGLSGSATPSGEDSLDEQRLRVTFTDVETGDVDFECSVIVTSRDFAPSIGASYVFSGKLEDISKDRYSATDDYVRMEFSVVDPDSTHVKWTKASEIAVTTNKPVLYY